MLAPLHARADGYADELLERARQLRLAERAEWRKLVHYVPNLVAPGVHSQIDSPAFFNAPGGKQDPRTELEATLRSFFAPAAAGDDHPQCR
ncbi:MAG TPA: hypothetical protein VNZ59_20120, partial [Burkholderiales bacterium]|nr:hypothetical protein [Burkholderiales bacterium]